MNYMESGHGAKLDSCLDDYIVSYESGLKLLKDAQKEILNILKIFIKKGNGIGKLSQEALLIMFNSINSWDNIYWYGVAVQLMEIGLLDPAYVDFIGRFIEYENIFFNSQEFVELKNNPKLLDKYNKTVRIKIGHILGIEKNNNV